MVEGVKRDMQYHISQRPHDTAYIGRQKLMAVAAEESITANFAKRMRDLGFNDDLHAHVRVRRSGMSAGQLNALSSGVANGGGGALADDQKSIPRDLASRRGQGDEDDDDLSAAIALSLRDGGQSGASSGTPGPSRSGLFSYTPGGIAHHPGGDVGGLSGWPATPAGLGSAGRATGDTGIRKKISFGFDSMSTPSGRGLESVSGPLREWDTLPASSSSSSASASDADAHHSGAFGGVSQGGGGQSPAPSGGARNFVAESLGRLIMDGLKDIPYYKDGQDIMAFLQMFKARVAVSELSEPQKVTFLATRLSAAARGVLTSVGPVASLAEACDALALRLSRESAQAMAEKMDLSMYRQEKDEGCFDFYLRYTAALSAQAVVLPDERLMLELRNRLSTLAREKLALYTTGRALSMDELLSYLRSVDRELYPRTASVHVTKGYGGKSGKFAVSPPKFEGLCHHCGKKGHRKADCRALAAGVPATAPPKPAHAGAKKSGWGRGAPPPNSPHGSKRGKFASPGGRGRGRGRGSRGGRGGGGQASTSPGGHGGLDHKHAGSSSSPPAAPTGRGGGRGGAGASRGRGGRGNGPPAQALGLGLADEASAGINGASQHGEGE